MNYIELLLYTTVVVPFIVHPKFKFALNEEAVFILKITFAIDPVPE